MRKPTIAHFEVWERGTDKLLWVLRAHDAEEAFEHGKRLALQNYGHKRVFVCREFSEARP